MTRSTSALKPSVTSPFYPWVTATHENLKWYLSEAFMPYIVKGKPSGKVSLGFAIRDICRGHCDIMTVYPTNVYLQHSEFCMWMFTKGLGYRLESAILFANRGWLLDSNLYLNLLVNKCIQLTECGWYTTVGCTALWWFIANIWFCGSHPVVNHFKWFTTAIILAQLDFSMNPNRFIFWAAEWNRNTLKKTGIGIHFYQIEGIVGIQLFSD